MKMLRGFYTFSAVLATAAIFALSGCKTSPPSAPRDTAPTVSITSHGSGDVVRGTVTVLVDASDDKGVTKVELYANNELVATDYNSPWQLAWDTEQWTDGSCTLVATAYDAANHSTDSDPVTVSIYNAFPVTLINSTFTTMTITVSGIQRSVLSGDSTVYTFTANPGTFTYTATTSGKTTSGTQIGVALQWGGTPIDVSNEVNHRIRLVVSSNYFFMFLNNTGKTTLGPVYVNYGLTDQTRDNIAIPGDGATYRTGYYRAYTNTEVRAYWAYPNTTTYSYWDQGVQFTMPWTTNQSVTLVNTYPTSKVGGAANYATSEQAPPSGVLTQPLRETKSAVLPVPDDGAVVQNPHE